MEGLAVHGLHVAFGDREVLRGVELTVEMGSFVGLVGESGSGKSLTALTTLGLLPRGARVVGGSIFLDDEEIVGPGRDGTADVRGSGIAMIFQSPLAALNPLMRVGRQLERVLRRKGRTGKVEQRCIELFGAVGFQDPEQVVRLYPHELSGGMCQRVMIAMGIASEPRVLLADEPTSSLDVTVQADILDLLEELKARTGMGMLLISHDLSVVAERCSSISVMWQGSVVESGPTSDVLGSPRHPFTRQLVRDLSDESLAAQATHSDVTIVLNEASS
jgi:ABC-type dipeptide/oligopeptide/nickel transport system ATPase component